MQRKNDCNLHIGVFPPLTVAAGGGFSEVCRVLISGGAKVGVIFAALDPDLTQTLNPNVGRVIL